MVDDEKKQKTIKIFEECSPMFVALGDVFRQKLILDIVEAGELGIDVATLTSKTELSRPAVSHHLKVLKDSGIIAARKDGTKIFYRMNINHGILDKMKALIFCIEDMIQV